MPARSRSYTYPKVLNSRLGRRMVGSLPGFLLKSPDANIAVTASAIGGMMEGLRKASAAKAREAFTDMFRFSEAPYTAITTFDKERRRNVTHTTHLDIPDEELFLKAAARSVGGKLADTGVFPIALSSATAAKIFFYVEAVGGTYKRRLGILTTAGDLYRSDLTHTPNRIDATGVITTTTTYPYYEVLTATGTPELLVGNGSVPDEATGIADWVEEEKYALDDGGFYVLDSIPLPLTVSIWDGAGEAVDGGDYSVSNNRITPSATLTMPLRIRYVRKTLYDSNSIVVTSGSGLSLMEAATLPVTAITYADAHRKPGQIIQLEVFSVVPPDIQTTEVTYSKSGTTVFTADTQPGIESPYTDTLLTIEPGQLAGSYVITLHSATALDAWKVNSADPALASDFAVQNTEVAFTGMARDAASGDYYVLMNDTLSLWESHPLTQKEIVLKTGRARFGGTRVTNAPADVKWVYLDGELFRVTNNILSDISGNIVSIAEDREMNFAYVTDEFDMNTLAGTTGYTFESLSIYQDTLVVLATQPDDDRVILTFDLETLELIAETSVTTLLNGAGSWSKWSTTFDNDDIKSMTVTDYGTVLILWNKDSVSGVTEHFLIYDACHYDAESDHYHFRYPTYSDFQFTEEGATVTVARSALTWQAVRHPIDQKAAVYTALRDPDRESMRERPHWSSGYTLLDFTNSYLMRIANREDTTEQGLLNVFSRVTGNDAYDLNAKLMHVTVPAYEAISAVNLVKGATKTTIAALAESTVTGSGSSSVTLSSLMTEFVVGSAGWLLQATFPEVAWTDEDRGVFRAILYEASGGLFRPTGQHMLGRVVNGRVILAPGRSIYLAAGTYAIGIGCDYADAFTATVYSNIGGTTMEGALPMGGIADSLTGAPQLDYYLMPELSNYDPETVIAGGSVRYYATDRTLVLNVAVPDDHEILVDYTTLRHNVSTNERFLRRATNVSQRARPASYVEVTRES